MLGEDKKGLLIPMQKILGLLFDGSESLKMFQTTWLRMTNTILLRFLNYLFLADHLHER